MSKYCNNVAVSVIIPTYNAGKTFNNLLSALYNQERVEKEIIIVDSGSTDGTVLTAKTMGCKLIEISQSEFSHSYSRNLGAENAENDYIVFMTQDAFPQDEYWLYNLINPLIKNQELVASTCIEQPRTDADLFSRMAIKQQADWILSGEKERVMYMPHEIPDGESRENIIRKNACLNDVACAYKKNVFLKYKYRLNYAEDLDMGKRLINSGHKMILLGDVKVIHSHNRSSMYYLRRMLVESVAFENIFPDRENILLTEREFIDATVWLYDKLVGWICELTIMPLQWSKNAILLRIGDICTKEHDIDQVHLKIKPYPDLEEFIIRMKEYQQNCVKNLDEDAMDIAYDLYKTKLDSLIGFLWNEEGDTISLKWLIEVCEAMYCLFGNVIGTLFGDLVLSEINLQYLQGEYDLLRKGI